MPQTTLPADLPENWVVDQIVSPNGTEAGLTPQHGYNYLMKQVNAAQRAVNKLAETGSNKTYATKSQFPSTGLEGFTYIDKSTGITYFWDSEAEDYQPLKAEAEVLWNTLD